MHIRWHYNHVWRKVGQTEVQKATKHRNFDGSGTFQPLRTKVHRVTPTGAEVLLWCNVMNWCTIMHWCTDMHWCTVINWCTIIHWCTLVKKKPGALVQKYSSGTLLAQKKFTGAHVQKYSPGALFCASVLFCRSTPYPPPPSVQKCTSHFGLNGSRREYF